MPLTGLVDADQDDVKLRLIDRLEDVARRLQRHLVLDGLSAEKNAHTLLCHGSISRFLAAVSSLKLHTPQVGSLLAGDSPLQS
jgi:hypothetical protein